MMKDMQKEMQLKKAIQSNKVKGKLRKEGKKVKEVEGFGGFRQQNEA